MVKTLEIKANTKQTDTNMKNQAGTAEKVSEGGCNKQKMQPSKPQSSFTFFLEEFEKKLRMDDPNITSLAVAIASADKWKSMSDADKAPYKAMGIRTLVDYNEYMLGGDDASDASLYVDNEEDEEDSDEFSSDVTDDDEEDHEEEEQEEDEDEEEGEDTPKCPPMPYSIFMKEFKKEFKQNNPDNKSILVVDRAAAAKWSSMSKAEKSRYFEMAEKMLSDYSKDMEAYYKKLEETQMRDEEKSHESLSFDKEDNGESDEDMSSTPLLLVGSPNTTPVVGQPEVSATAPNSFANISSNVEKVLSLPSFSSRFQPDSHMVILEDQVQSLRGLAHLSLSDIARNGRLPEVKDKLKTQQGTTNQHKFEVLLLLLEGLGANLAREIQCLDDVDSAPRKEACLQQTVVGQLKELNSNEDNLSCVEEQIDELKVQLKALEDRKSTLSNDSSIVQTELEKSVQELKLLKQKPVPTPAEYNKAKAIVDVIDRAWETAMATP